jgi:hypothetical protein
MVLSEILTSWLVVRFFFESTLTTLKAASKEPSMAAAFNQDVCAYRQQASCFARM